MPFDRTPLTDDLTDTVHGAVTEAEASPALWPIYLGLAIFLVAMAASVTIFGIPGLYIPAVAFVPVMYVILIRLTLG